MISLERSGHDVLRIYTILPATQFQYFAELVAGGPNATGALHC